MILLLYQLGARLQSQSTHSPLPQRRTWKSHGQCPPSPVHWSLKDVLWNERETRQWGHSSVSPTVSSGFPVNSARYPLRVDLWCCGSGQLVSGEIAWELVKFYKPWFHWPESRYLQLGLGLHPRAGESLSGCLAGCISSPASCPKNMRRKEKSCMFSSPFDQRRAGRRPWEGTPIVLDDNKRS